MLNLEEIERKIPALGGFTAHYRKAAVPVLVHFERQRINAILFMFLSIVPLCGALVLMAYEQKLAEEAMLISVLTFFGAIGLFVFGVTQLRASRRKAKVALVQLICHYLGFDYREKPDHSFVNHFKELGLVARYEAMYLEDELSGEVSGLRFVIQEAALMDWKTRPINPVLSNFRRVEDRFHGLIGSIECPTPFSATTMVTYKKNILEKLSEQSLPGQRVLTGGTEFDAAFRIFSTDKGEALELLSPESQRRLLKLDAFFKNGLAFAYHRGHFLFTAHRQSDWMETRGDVNDVSDERYAALLALDVAMIHHLLDVLGVRQKGKMITV